MVPEVPELGKTRLENDECGEANSNSWPCPRSYSLSFLSFIFSVLEGSRD